MNEILNHQYDDRVVPMSVSDAVNAQGKAKTRVDLLRIIARLDRVRLASLPACARLTVDPGPNRLLEFTLKDCEKNDDELPVLNPAHVARFVWGECKDPDKGKATAAHDLLRIVAGFDRAEIEDLAQCANVLVMEDSAQEAEKEGRSVRVMIEGVGIITVWADDREHAILQAVHLGRGYLLDREPSSVTLMDAVYLDSEGQEAEYPETPEDFQAAYAVYRASNDWTAPAEYIPVES